jgi:hypothetical protein
MSSACAVGALRSATSVVVLPIAASAEPVLMASAATAANTLIKVHMRAPLALSILAQAQLNFIKGIGKTDTRGMNVIR